MRALLDIVFPTCCPSCDARTNGWLCDPCRATLRWITTCCARCGSPSMIKIKDCRDCRALKPTFAVARAALVYEGAARDALMRFKLGGERRAARHLAAAMHEPARALPRPDVLTAVPSGRTALHQRGFNPAEEIARALARTMRLPYRRLLTKTRETSDQAGLNRQQRQTNLRGAFRPVAKPPSRVMLIDDILTTGATAEACASALSRYGIAHLSVLTFARAI